MYLDFYGFRGVPQTTRGVLESRTVSVLVSEGLDYVCYIPTVFDQLNNTLFFLKKKATFYLFVFECVIDSVLQNT